MTTLITVLLAGVVAAAAKGPLGTYGMPPCKTCGSGRLHSRDELLAYDDGSLLKMKADLTKESDVLQNDLDSLKEKNGAELGKLSKRLSDMNAAYKKFGKDAVARTAKFTTAKAKASKDFDDSLGSTLQAHNLIGKLHTSMNKMRSYLNPFVDKMISGKGWPKGCKCEKAKALLQRLEASLHLASFQDVEEVAAPKHREALLRKSAKVAKPASQEKYKLVRVVMELEERRAKLMQDKSENISGFGQQQSLALDRIDAARIKSSLKVASEHKYEEGDKGLQENLKNQMQAAGSWGDSAKTELARLTKDEEAAMKLFKSFKAELKKCKCLF